MLQDLKQIQFESFINMNESFLNKARKCYKDLANRLNETMQERFQSFDNPLFEHMSWMDPKVWEDERTYKNVSLEYLANHFKVTLEKASFQRQKLIVIPEWMNLKIYIKSHFESKHIRDETNTRQIWNLILLYC